MKTILILLLLFISVAGQELPPEGTYETRVRLRWDLYEHPADAEGLAGFRLHMGPTSGEYTVIIDMGDVTPDELGYKYAINGRLEVGSVWFLALTAYNEYGLESDYSNEISFTTKNLGDPKPPAPPKNFRLLIE